MSTASPATLTLLAFDYGQRRIGVAVGEVAAGGVTRGIATLQSAAGRPPWAALDALVRDWRPQLLVMGLACNMDDTESTMTARCRRFGDALAERYALPVEYVDERLTSHAAADALREQRARGHRRRRVRTGDVDREAARLIARQWLEQHRPAAGAPAPRSEP